MKRRLKINGFIIFLVILCLAFFPTVFLRSAKQAYGNEFAGIFGIAFILLGQILRASSRGYKSEYSGNGRALIQSGPYAMVRNPMYLGILLIGLGIVLMLFKWWVVCIFLLVFILRYLMLIFGEEKKMRALFSKDYQDYCKRVPRILPSITAIIKTDIVECLPLKLAWIKKEIGSILAVLLLVLFLEGWQDVTREGIKVYLKGAILFLSVIILFIFLLIYLIRCTNNPERIVLPIHFKGRD
jgi:protein-S-isoprenylcysteine O-methyltransferase Ste14